MSNISRYLQDRMETEDFQFGWESAARGEPCPDWLPAPGHTEKLENQRLGWTMYHEQGRSL